MTKQQYRDARKLIEDPANWIKGMYWIRAEDIDALEGQEKAPFQGCSMGACYTAAGAGNDIDTLELEQAVKELTKGDDRSPEWFNDRPDTTHADVLRMFDRAIELAKEA